MLVVFDNLMMNEKFWPFNDVPFGTLSNKLTLCCP